LKRWYYRTHKTGEIVFANARNDLPIRKIANAIGRVCRGEKTPVVTTKAVSSESNPDQPQPS
jgi:hypothetical protein